MAGFNSNIEISPEALQGAQRLERLRNMLIDTAVESMLLGESPEVVRRGFALSAQWQLAMRALLPNEEAVELAMRDMLAEIQHKARGALGRANNEVDGYEGYLAASRQMVGHPGFGLGGAPRGMHQWNPQGNLGDLPRGNYGPANGPNMDAELLDHLLGPRRTRGDRNQRGDPGW